MAIEMPRETNAEPLSNSAQQKDTGPVVWKAVLTSILFTLAFAILHTVLISVVAWLLYTLSNIPILSFLLFWASPVSDSPDIFVLTTAAGAAGIPLLTLLEKILKHKPTFALSCALIGSFIVIYYVIILLINLFTGSFSLIWNNLVMIAAGCFVFSIGNEK